LVLLAGLALWIAALDAVEPLAQELDHPGRRDTYPMEQGELLFRHLPVSAALMLLVGIITSGVAALPGSGQVPIAAAGILVITLALLSGAGAVVSAVQGAPNQVDSLAMITPEIASSRAVFRAAWPPGLAILGTLPLLAARAASRSTQAGHLPPATATALAAAPLLILAILVANWVRFREPIHAWFKRAAEEMSPSKAAERSAAQRAAIHDEAEGDDDGYDDED
jgi:hypothetical protein